MRRFVIVGLVAGVLSGCGLEMMEPAPVATPPQAMGLDKFSAEAAVGTSPGKPNYFYLEVTAKSLFGKSETKGRVWVRTPDMPGRVGADQIPTELYLGANGIIYGTVWSPERTQFFQIGRHEATPSLRPGDPVAFKLAGSLKMDWRGLNPMAHSDLIVTLPRNPVMEPVAPRLLIAR